MSRQKTLMLLGGSRQQVVAIKAAKACGYRTVLCDYLIDNPGQREADVFYLESTTDLDKMLAIAQKEQVDGVIAYSSDPAALTAAYVSEQMGLPSNPLKSVKAMSVKTLFRQHMREHGIPCPQAASLNLDVTAEQAREITKNFRFPVVVKPTDSSGSKGVSVVHLAEDIPAAVQHADMYGRSHLMIVEEYVRRSFPRVIGGDIFVIDGKVRFWGLMSCLRDDACDLIPVGKRMPAGLNDEQLDACKGVLRRLVESLDIRYGELNVEIIIDEKGVPNVIELGGRAGGNMIPIQLSDASGIDLVKANVKCAMGEDPGDIDWQPHNELYATYVLHVVEGGIFEGVHFTPEIERTLYRQEMYVEPGDIVSAFDGANKALGILFLKFESRQEMDAILAEIDKHVQIRVKLI